MKHYVQTPSRENILTKYPVLSDFILLHKAPEGAYLIERPRINESSTRSSMRYALINQDALNLLLLCDGTRTVKEILEILSKNEQEFKGNLIFILKALNFNHIYLLDSPLARSKDFSSIIKGSYKYTIPLHLVIELTYKCNFRCKHCYAFSSFNYSEEIKTDALLFILKKYAKAGSRIVELTGGEPLLHSSFLDILEFCCKNFLIVSVITNGYYIDRNLVKICQKYKDVISFSITLFSDSSDYHDYFTGVPGSFDRAVNSIKMLTDAKIRVRVSMCITPQNYTKIENVIELAKKLGASSFAYSPILPFGRASRSYNTLKLSPNQVKMLMRKVKKLRRKYRGFIQIIPEHVVESFINIGCGAGRKSIVINPKGEVRPCIMLPSTYLYMGNVFRDSLETIMLRFNDL
ncbi:MAG: radical SAM protein, partial [archaeon GB-1867-035]|nr:radical SAM protein [Candidatus Culexmicrobium profundum]